MPIMMILVIMINCDNDNSNNDDDISDNLSVIIISCAEGMCLCSDG